MQKLKEYAKKLGLVLLYSSENPAQFSRTIKNGLLAILAILAVFNVNTSAFPQVVDFSAELAINISAVILTARSLWFAFKKAKLTALGQNAVLNEIH